MAKRRQAEGTTLELTLDPQNAKRHGVGSVKAVESSLTTLKAGRSILTDNAGVVIAGNATAEVAEKLGIPKRFVHTTGDELIVVVRDDLSPGDPRRRALALADNRAAEVDTDWNESLVVELYNELPAELRDATGLDADTIDALIQQAHAALEEFIEDEPQNVIELGELTYRVIVKVDGERSQAELIERLESEGFECLPLMS